MLLLAVAVTGGTPAVAQENGRLALARELARLMVDETMHRAIGQQVGAGMVQTLGATLQERLNRRLLDAEWRMLFDIVGRFVRETLPPTRIEEIAAGVYAQHFDEAELRELLQFQRSAVGRKVSRLAPMIGIETLQAIDRELRTSPAVPGVLAELLHAFPVLGTLQSP